ncbi:MAG TPA: NADH-quinone oxidoreductase subunit N, partial [Acetobacteraceae bacterium]|nr:NADH-quinone oxidoreductase subunit N [Acetobacteraceae bacterium]
MSPELKAGLPFLVLAIAITLVMLLIAWRRDHRMIAGLSVAGLIAALLAIIPASQVSPVRVTPLFLVDGFTLFFLGVVLASSIAVALLSHAYLGSMRDEAPEEYYLLLLLAALGAGALAASVHFAAF